MYMYTFADCLQHSSVPARLSIAFIFDIWDFISLFLKYMSCVFSRIFLDHYNTLFYTEKYVHWNSILEW